MNTLETVKPIIFSAGRIAKDLFGKSICSRVKTRHELVSEADERVDDLLRGFLLREFPEYGIYSEESREVVGSADHRWIIDPLDGTAYFLCGMSYFSVCLSLELDGRIVEAFVYNPLADELYYGCEENGKATLNGAPIHPSDVESMLDARVGVGFSANKSRIDEYFKDWHAILDSCQKGMGLLSPALNICNVARGRLDVFIDNGSSMEGHSGAALILRNAGGCVRNYDLTEWDHRTTGVVAVNRRLADVLMQSHRPSY